MYISFATALLFIVTGYLLYRFRSLWATYRRQQIKTCVSTQIKSAHAQSHLIVWDIDHVLLHDGSRWHIAWNYPNKKAVLRTLKFPVLLRMLSLLTRYATCLEASGNEWIKIADECQSPALRQFVISMINAKDPNNAIIAIARYLKGKGYRQILASNQPKECFDQLILQPQFSFFKELFDLESSLFLISESVAEGIYKPRSQFFVRLLLQNGQSLKPSNVIFIDNKHANIKTAEDAGMQVIYASYKECQKIRNTLECYLGIEIPQELCLT